MKLTKQLKTDLANAYQCVMEVSLLDMKAPLRYINHYIAENVSGYGTAADEKIQSREDFRKMVMTARQQTKGMLFIAKIITAHQPKFIDDTTALFRDEIVVQIGDKKNKHSLHLWFSALFKYQHNKWQLVMFHGSMPDAGSSTEDTFHVREAEKKLKELELVVAQRTSDLQMKTRELEIEASLERVRAAAMGMYKPDDLLNIAQVLFKEIVALGFTNIRCALIHIFNDKERYFFDYDYSDFTGGKITQVPYKGNKTIEKFLELVRHSDDAFVKVVMKGKEFTEWKLFRKRSGQLHDERMTKAKQLNYYFYSIGAGNIGLSTFGNITAEQLEILKRFRNVFDFSYRRYLDIEKAEAQTREAQIELALERVRAKSLAMHTTSELQEVVATVHRELLKLDIGINGGSFIAINNDIDKELHCWGSGGTADTLNEVHIPYYNKPFYTNLVKRIKKVPSFFTEVYSQKEKKEFFTFLFKYDPWSKLKAKEKKETLSSPGGYTRSCCVSKHTSIFIINHFGEKFSDAENDILKRFANVFEQTYTRFLDLKKAESQAKEAQIQLGLERVRARTMAMQNSDELSEVSFLLDTQVRSLGIKTQGCAFNIYGPEESTEWFSNEIGTMPAYKTPMKDLFLRYYEAGKNGELMHIEKFEGDACVAHYEYLCTIPGMGDGLKAMIEAGGSFPKRQTDHVVYFKYGYVLFLTLEDVPEAHNIFIRFGKVFEQTYTRFLDLQKAEAQTREAQIELSLERIRARVTAMKVSADLLDIVVTMRTEFVALGHEAHYFWHMRWQKDIYEKAMTSGDGSRIGNVMTLPRHIHGDIALIANWEKSKQPFVVFTMDAEAAVDYVQKMISLGKFEQVDPNAPTLDDIRHIGGLTFIMARTTHGEIGYSLPGEVPYPSEDGIATLVRFAAVFDLAYRRFEDLKSSEKQIREGQIELALERVRARTMSMQHSNELLDAATLLFQQIESLGAHTWNVSFNIWTEDKKQAIAFNGTKEGFGRPFNTPSNENVFLDFYNASQQEDELFVKEMSGKELELHYEYLATLPGVGLTLEELKEAGVSLPTSQVFNVAYFPQGYLMFITYDQVPEFADIFKRFARVFDQTYTRFLDLQKAEAQTLRAEQDLVEIKAARQKAEETLVELQSTQKQLIQAEKMASLGELTAGIAHEIQNPLNFVNNFSEVNKELLTEMKDEMQKGNYEDAKEIVEDVIKNEVKINHHGKRADAIVKGMLQHSSNSTGQKELTNINALADEYLRLAYHGLRAKDKSFNATLKTDYEESIGSINIIPQDIGRVILNLITNAFYAVDEKKKQLGEGYEPTVLVSTKKINDKVEIKVADNGNGIPQNIKDKIFQPFFTTKPTGQGTGLGLSLAYDIVKAHGGEIKVESKVGDPGSSGKGKGTTFIIQLPQ